MFAEVVDVGDGVRLGVDGEAGVGVAAVVAECGVHVHLQRQEDAFKLRPGAFGAECSQGILKGEVSLYH
jgi:hypothetical protein